MTLDEFLDTPPARRGKKGCMLGRVLIEIGPDRAGKLAAMLDDSEYTNAFIAKGLTAGGHAMSSSTVRNHRARVCACA